MTPRPPIEEYEKLLEAASVQPWTVRKDEVTGPYSAVLDAEGLGLAIDLHDSDAALIAAAPTALRKLMAYCRSLEARLADASADTRKREQQIARLFIDLESAQANCNALATQVDTLSSESLALSKLSADAEARGMEEAADYVLTCEAAIPDEKALGVLADELRALAAAKRGGE